MSTQFSLATKSEWLISTKAPASLIDIPGLVAVWRERWWNRKELRRLASDGSHLIDDIGLTHREVQVEIAKPFWQA